jgi:iron complex outermembrane receptor protein
MNRAHLLTATLLILSPLAAGHAQTAPARAADNVALAEVVVTAQRRTENLQEVPISITAFSGDLLEKTNVKGATDYLAQTPNVSYTEDKQSGSRGLAVAIRGVNNLVTGENAFVNSVGVYLDEFSIASVPNGVSNPFMPDMERVEVLRGPQGTYFGRNSLGGALNLTTHDPTDKYEGQVTVGAESYSTNGNSENVTGIFNMPVADTFKVRGVAYYEDSTGIVKNVGPGNGAGHKWINLRLRAIWTPTEATRVSFNLLYGKEHQGADETVPSGVNDLDTIDTFGYQPGKAFNHGTGFWPTNDSKFSADLQQRNDDKTTIGIVNIAQKLSSDLTWKTVAGIIKTDQERFFDNDLVGNLDLLSRTNLYTGKSYSLESRLESRTSALDWVVGAMYAKDEQDQFNDVAISGNPTATLTRDGMVYGFLPPFPKGLGLALNNKGFKIESSAAFADATMRLGDLTEVFAGARYTNDKAEKSELQDGIRPSCGCGPSNPTFFPSFINFPRPVADGTRTFSNVTPRIGVRFKVADSASVYATISEGYKAGGLSTGNNTNAAGSPAIVLPYNKETLWNYEAGVKSEFADHRVRLNVSVFYMKWKDLQFEAFRFLTPGDLSSNFEQTINIPSADAKGVEIELVARATEHLTLGGSFGYLDTKILENQACGTTTLPADCIGGHTLTTVTGGYMVDLKGLDIPNAPKVTANLFGEYRWPIAGNSAWLRGEYQHRASLYTDIEAAANQQTLGPSPNQGLTRFVPADQFPYKVPAFDVFNLRGGFDWQRASVTLYVQNLTDEKYYTGTYQKFGLSGIRLRPNPRTIGANLTFRF